MAKTAPAPKPAPPAPAPAPTPTPAPAPVPKADDPLSLHYGSAQPGHGVILTPAQKAAAPQPDQALVKMDVLTDRSYAGKAYKTGDTVDVPPEHVEALTMSGFAARADRAERARAERDAPAARTEALRNLVGDTTVTPLTTHDVSGAKPKE